MRPVKNAIVCGISLLVHLPKIASCAMAETPRQAWENRRLERRRSNTSQGDFNQKLWDTGPTRNSDSDMLTMVRVAVAKQDNTCRTTASGVEFGSMPRSGNGSVDPEMLKSNTEAHQKNHNPSTWTSKNPARGPRIGWSENRQHPPEIPMFRWKQMWPICNSASPAPL